MSCPKFVLNLMSARVEINRKGAVKLKQSIKKAGVAWAVVFFWSVLVYSPGSSAALLSLPESFSIPRPLAGEAQAVAIAGSTVFVKGLTHQTNKVFVDGREVEVSPDGSFEARSSYRLGNRK